MHDPHVGIGADAYGWAPAIDTCAHEPGHSVEYTFPVNKAPHKVDNEVPWEKLAVMGMARKCKVGQAARIAFLDSLGLMVKQNPGQLF